ncbi:hypothetical protein T10_4847 [Trichinella papuae]|uniref:Uncharacterized protein n=1 Tax=Trichinella papuae TaxID=268474 RepID=A0A0V1M0T4_9BILA|nr:hypothetical protein T10_12819 [Trichinella papuae]KRZ65685.1 hypothetical protein T10_4847 [Trichinella papuae]
MIIKAGLSSVNSSQMGVTCSTELPPGYGRKEPAAQQKKMMITVVPRVRILVILSSLVLLSLLPVVESLIKSPGTTGFSCHVQKRTELICGDNGFVANNHCSGRNSRDTIKVPAFRVTVAAYGG